MMLVQIRSSTMGF